LFEFGGPNGALLASLLAIQLGREIHVWANDNGERYPKEPASSAAADLDELAVAGVLLSTKPIGSATRVGGWFPNSIERLATWLTAGAGRATRIRVGFLDPDNYAEGQTQVSSFDHRNWLRTLAEGSPRVLSAMFSGCQNRGPGNSKRDQRLASFHGDESALYPFSVVFEYGNFQTGVKIRWPQESLAEIGARLIRRVRTEWQNWDPSLGSLAVHVNGQSGS
jgi:hypothetical protein